MNCKEANEIQITDFLLSQGIEPKRICGNNYWYLSPIRNENTPSFKVDITINRWYDHGIGVGGKLVDLGIRLFEIDVDQFLSRLRNQSFPDSFSFHKPETQRALPVINKIKDLENKALLSYLSERVIRDLFVTKHFCKEVYFSVGSKNYFGLGFKNDSGGYELRNKYFKGCIGQKNISTIIHADARQKKNFALFEGFFDFLSKYQEGGELTEFSHIVLNSVNQIHRAIEVLQHEDAEKVIAYFDNDEAGRKCFSILQQTFPQAEDHSYRYAGFKDINEMAIHNKHKYHG